MSERAADWRHAWVVGILPSLLLRVCWQDTCRQKNVFVAACEHLSIKILPDLLSVYSCERRLRIGSVLSIPVRNGKLVVGQSSWGVVSKVIASCRQFESRPVVGAHRPILELKLAEIVEPWHNVEVFVALV